MTGPARSGLDRRGWLAAALLLAAAPGRARAGRRAAPGIEVEQPWARATLPAAPFGVAYLILRNPGAAADRLVGAATPAAEAVELNLQCGGGTLARGLPLPPGEAVALQPGGVHLMLVGLRMPLLRGQQVPLTLRFAEAEPRSVLLRVEAMGARRPGAAAARGLPPHASLA